MFFKNHWILVHKTLWLVLTYIEGTFRNIRGGARPVSGSPLIKRFGVLWESRNSAESQTDPAAGCMETLRKAKYKPAAKSDLNIEKLLSKPGSGGVGMIRRKAGRSRGYRRSFRCLWKEVFLCPFRSSWRQSHANFYKENRMKHWWKAGHCLVLKFGSKCGEITVVLPHPCPGGTVSRKEMEPVVRRLQKEYVSRNGIRLGELRRIFDKKHTENEIR